MESDRKRKLLEKEQNQASTLCPHKSKHYKCMICRVKYPRSFLSKRNELKNFEF